MPRTQAHGRSWPRAVWCVAGLLVAHTPALGQARLDDLTELRRQIAAQQAQLDAQARLIEAQRRDLDVLRQQVDAAAAARPAPSPSEAASSTVPVEDQAARRMPEMPTEVVSAGDFPGSIRIPGTAAAFRIGGQGRLTLVHTLAPLGTDDRFVTSSIPVDVPAPGEASRTVYAPQASRFNLDVRTTSRSVTFRTFIEADFAGSGNAMRLRHAFTQGKRWLFGQTWSTFSDPEAEPIGIDFEGLNAISLFRQPQVRLTVPLRASLRLAFAVENPSPDLTGAQGIALTPDFVARLRWEPDPSQPMLLTRARHVQASIIVRQLRGALVDRPQVAVATGGFGANISGVLVPRWRAADRVKFAVNAGWGIGRYITDLGTLGGQDAIYDPLVNDLRALPVSSGYIGYERAWRTTVTSAFTYGVVNVANLDIQSHDALHRTQRATFNLTWTPIPEADIVIELLTGTRVNKDGHHGSSSQIQTGWTFRF